MADPQTADDDRDRGILSPADRAYLRDESTYTSDGSARSARYRIRNRVRNALADFGLLFAYLESEDRRQVLDRLVARPDRLQAELGRDPIEDAPPELEWDLIDPEGARGAIATGGLRHMIAFGLLLLCDVFLDELDQPPATLGPVVEALVSESLADAFAQHGVLIDAEVSVDIDAADVEPADLRARSGEGLEDLTEQEVEWLIHLRELAFEEMVAYVRDTRDAGAGEDT